MSISVFNSIKKWCVYVLYAYEYMDTQEHTTILLSSLYNF